MRIHRRRRSGQQVKKELAPVFDANEKITADELRVIGETGEMLGVLSRASALALATEREMDLIVVSPKAVPPVAKLADYGQFKYQKEKEARKQKSQSRQTEVKVIRLTARIGAHDMDVRLSQALEFLRRGDKVKMEIVLRGREKAHPEIAKGQMETFVLKVQEALVTDKKQISVEQALLYQAGRLTEIIGVK